MEKQEYGQLSAFFYELTKPVGYSIEGDIEYYSRQLAGILGRVLEAGVGTGRMLIPLAKNGIIMDGVDSSPEMLKRCKVNLEKHQVSALLYEQDISHLSLPHRYDAIIMPAGSLGLIPREKIDRVLQHFHDHLMAGGKLLLDLEMPASFQAGAVSRRRLAISEDQSLLLRSTSQKIEWLAQKTSYTNTYELIEKGRVTKTETADLTLHWYGVSEFEMILSRMGFEDIRCDVGYGSGQSDLVTFSAFKF